MKASRTKKGNVKIVMTVMQAERVEALLRDLTTPPGDLDYLWRALVDRH